MTTGTHTSRRDANIDMIRTVAIVAVVCVHMDVFGYTPQLSCLSDIMLTAVMLMFVICSGHFIFPLRGSARDFLLRRMRALLPGYILAAVFYSWAQVFLAGDIVYSVGHRMEWVWLVAPVGFLWFVTMMTGPTSLSPFSRPGRLRHRGAASMYSCCSVLLPEAYLLSASSPTYRVCAKPPSDHSPDSWGWP